MVWRRRTEGHAGRDRREAQQGDQRWPRRSHDEGAACRPGWRRARALARRLWQAHRRRNREVGQGGQVFRRKGRVMKSCQAAQVITTFVLNWQIVRRNKLKQLWCIREWGLSVCC